jgi:acetoin utilization protein AcuB
MPRARSPLVESRPERIAAQRRADATNARNRRAIGGTRLALGRIGRPAMIKAPIKKFMTKSPYTVDSQFTLSDAHQLMEKHHIRHLPVVDRGRLVGVVTLGDLLMIERFHDVDPEVVCVEEAMMPVPYCVEPETPLEEVVTHMAEKKIGSTLVVHEGRVEGIFTALDGLRSVVSLLHRRK